MRHLALQRKKAQKQFGFLLDAFKYGVPPHAGLAYGLDRLVILMAKVDSIRDVIAFPKVKDASCLMSEAPDIVDEKQLEELGIAIRVQEEKRRNNRVIKKKEKGAACTRKFVGSFFACYIS